MTSANAAVNELHAAYLQIMGLDPSELPLSFYDERGWLSFINEGMTADDLRLGIANRRRGIKTLKRNETCIALRNIFGGDERLAEFRQDVCMEKIRLRQHRDQDKNSVLAATFRVPEEKRERHVSEIAIEALRKAAS